MVAQDRFHALDAVRAFALLAGIVLHTILPFVFSDSPSRVLAVTFYVIHIFRMSLFFMIAGFFARWILHRRGIHAFIKDRSMRILVPMVGGWFIFGTLTIVMMHWGATGTFGWAPPGFTLLHFWFLYYLTIFYVLALTLREALNGFIDRRGRLRAAMDGVLRNMISTWIAPILLGVPLFIVLYFDDAWSLWSGITSGDGFRLELSGMIGYGTAFGFGWCLNRQAGLVCRWQAAWHVHLLIGVALAAVCLSIVGVTPSESTVPGLGWSRILYTGCYTAAVWFWTFGIVGAGLRFCSQPSLVWRYLSDSSYYLYLAHLPTIYFLHMVLAKVPLHWSAKVPLIMALALIVLLLMYHYWVRPTFVGALLNGRKYPRRAALWEIGLPNRASIEARSSGRGA
jgi:surface polysaccharide O-acyltransferase-like enzyme